ncbi:MAG: PLDc N-terminal domain-containing protein [Acidimicrobiia bacterium]
MGAEVIVAVVMALAFCWIWGIVDSVRRDHRAFRDSGRSKTLWVITIALFGWITAVGYLVLVRPSVRRFEIARSRARSTGDAMTGPGPIGDIDAWAAFASRREPSKYDIDR